MTDVDAVAVLKWIQANDLPDFTRRAAQKAQEGRFRSIERLNKALERLEHQDVLRELIHSFRTSQNTEQLAS